MRRSGSRAYTPCCPHEGAHDARRFLPAPLATQPDCQHWQPGCARSTDVAATRLWYAAHQPPTTTIQCANTTAGNLVQIAFSLARCAGFLDAETFSSLQAAHRHAAVPTSAARQPAGKWILAA
jgi:hypothetical protein